MKSTPSSTPTWTVWTSVASSYSKDLALNVILGTLLLPGPLPDSFGMRGRSGKSENASSWCESDRCRTSLTDFARFREPIFGFEVFRLNEVAGGPRVEDRRRDRRFSWRSISGIKILKTILETENVISLHKVRRHSQLRTSLTSTLRFFATYSQTTLLFMRKRWRCKDFLPATLFRGVCLSPHQTVEMH